MRTNGRHHPDVVEFDALTLRELEVAVLLCGGLRNAQIAERLCRSVRTVEHHVQAIIKKLGVSTRTQVVAVALRAGIAPLESAGGADARRLSA